MADDKDLQRLVNEQFSYGSIELQPGASAPVRLFDFEMIGRVPQQDAERLTSAFMATLEERARAGGAISPEGQVAARDVQMAVQEVARLVATQSGDLSPQTVALLNKCDLWPIPDQDP